MFSLEDIYGYDTINCDKNYENESVYQYFPLFHHSADEYSLELFYGKEQIQDSLPTDTRIEQQNSSILHPQQQTADTDSISIDGSASVWNQARSAQSILYPDYAIQKVERCRRGGRFQTNNIGKHLKSLTNRLLFALQDAKILNSSELLSVRQFKERNGSKKDFQELLRHRNLREKFTEFCSMKNFVKEILSSAKMSFRSKLMMVKHLEKLRVVGLDDSPSWKE